MIIWMLRKRWGKKSIWNNSLKLVEDPKEFYDNVDDREEEEENDHRRENSGTRESEKVMQPSYKVEQEKLMIEFSDQLS